MSRLGFPAILALSAIVVFAGAFRLGLLLRPYVRPPPAPTRMTTGPSPDGSIGSKDATDGGAFASSGGSDGGARAAIDAGTAAPAAVTVRGVVRLAGRP